MNEKQCHALQLLHLITSSERGKLRNIQGILGLTSYQPPYTLRPEFWEEEWCSGWKWQISESFAECMDISLRPYLEPKLDENGDRIPLRNEDGSIKLTPKTKKPVLLPFVNFAGHKEETFVSLMDVYCTISAFPLESLGERH